MTLKKPEATSSLSREVIALQVLLLLLSVRVPMNAAQGNIRRATDEAVCYADSLLASLNEPTAID